MTSGGDKRQLARICCFHKIVDPCKKIHPPTAYISMANQPAALFDLDGTLLDTLADIAAAANHALVELGQPAHPVAAYRYMAGDGADVLMQRALPKDSQVLAAEALRCFKAYYIDHAFDHTALYDGVAMMLDGLVERGWQLAVLSNKPHENTQRVVERLLGRWPWAEVAGHKPDVPKKPDPTSALAIVERLGLSPDEVWYLGDTNTDMLTATSAGMIAVGVLWGFRDRDELVEHGARHLIDEPMQLLDLIR